MPPNDRQFAALDANVIRQFLQRLAERCEQPTTLYLLGGSALCLLGHPRVTVDIDYVGSDLPNLRDARQVAIQAVAREMHIEVEGVPIDKFIPRNTFERRSSDTGRIEHWNLAISMLYVPGVLPLIAKEKTEGSNLFTRSL